MGLFEAASRGEGMGQVLLGVRVSGLERHRPLEASNRGPDLSYPEQGRARAGQGEGIVGVVHQHRVETFHRRPHIPRIQSRLGLAEKVPQRYAILGIGHPFRHLRIAGPRIHVPQGSQLGQRFRIGHRSGDRRGPGLDLAQHSGQLPCDQAISVHSVPAFPRILFEVVELGARCRDQLPGSTPHRP